MRAAALLLAAGRGERMGSEEPKEPKAFLRLAGKTLLERAVETIEACPDVECFVVAAPPGHETAVGAVARTPKLVAVATGGETRQASVRLALAALPPGYDVVVCHDVARPLAGPKLFSEVLAPLRDGKGGEGVVPVVSVVDSVKRIRGDLMESVSRDGLYLAQTPQAFRTVTLTAAHARAEAEGTIASDDADLLEKTGYRPAEPVRGDPLNIKITRSEDLRLAEALLGLVDG